MGRIAWRFEDLTDGTVMLMNINPNEGASPEFRKNLTRNTTTAPGGGRSVLIFEGADPVQEFAFSGAILEQEHYDFLYTLWKKRHLVRLTDDLGRVFTLYLESFAPKRKVSGTRPWRMDYDATAVVIE